jgi:hypothetical protein
VVGSSTTVDDQVDEVPLSTTIPTIR